MLLLVLVLFAHADAEEDCLEPLTLRAMRPDFHATDVPTNTRITVSLIGGGEPEHFDLRLVGESGLVETTQQSWCYAHESDFERHCTLVLTPLEALDADTRHMVQLDPSDRHPEPVPDGLQSVFWTGSSPLMQTLDAPQLESDGMRPRPEEDVEPCEWTDAEQVDFMVRPSPMEGSELATVEIIETLDDGGASSVHTLFLDPSGGMLDFRQVLEPGDVRPRCYEAVVVDAVGAASPASEPVCIYGGTPDEEPDDTGAARGPEDSADSGVTDLFDTAGTGADDTGGVSTDSSGQSTGASQLPPILAATSDGCGKAASVLVVWSWLFGLAGWRRRSGGIAESRARGPSGGLPPR